MQQYKTAGQRQIPRVKEYTASKLYTDILYGYLQENCEIREENEEKIKFIPKNKLKFIKIAHSLNLSRQTVSTKFKSLIALGLIEEGEKEYLLPTLPSAAAFLIALPTLKVLLSTLKERTISVYIYLLNRFIANKEKPYSFTIMGLKNWTGLSLKTDSNNYIITDILLVLQKLNLIKYEEKFLQKKDGTIQHTYQLIWATNKLE